MTVGQRIQHYRKLQGLSQEELGQKLLVSRQTVSLWENDQTLPTIDNLVRLKEIFGVSIDEILTDTCQEDAPAEPQPLEKYVTTFTAQEQEEIRKVATSQFNRKMIIGTSLWWLVWTIFFAFEVWLLNGLLFGVICFCFILYNNVSSKKTWKKRYPNLPWRVYSYDIYEDYMLQQIHQNGQFVESRHIPFVELRYITTTVNFVVFVHENFLIYFRKKDLVPNSRLYPLAQKVSTASDKLRAVGHITWIASILAAVGSVILFYRLNWDIDKVVSQGWHGLLFLPIPIASVVVSVMLKRKGDKWVVNLLVGLISISVLLYLGATSFIFRTVEVEFSDPQNTDYIDTIEDYTGIDIPEPTSVHTVDFSSSPHAYGWTTTSVTSTIFFDEQAVMEFERDMRMDARWQMNFKNELAAIMPNVYTEGRYVLVYNIDFDQWNQVPTASGDYHMLMLVYDPTGNTMFANEYILHYGK